MKNLLLPALLWCCTILSVGAQIPPPDSIFQMTQDGQGSFYVGMKNIRTYDEADRLLTDNFSYLDSSGMVLYRSRDTYAYNSNGDDTFHISEEQDAEGNVIDTLEMQINIYDDQLNLIEENSFYDVQVSQTTYYYDDNGCLSDQEFFHFELNPLNGELIKTLAASISWERDVDCNMLKREVVFFSDGSSYRLLNEFDDNDFLIKQSRYDSEGIGQDFELTSESIYLNDDLGRVLEATRNHKFIQYSGRWKYTYEGSQTDYSTREYQSIHLGTLEWTVVRQEAYFFTPAGERRLKEGTYYHPYDENNLVATSLWRYVYDEQGFLLFKSNQYSWLESDTLDRFEEWEYTYSNRCDGALLEEYGENTVNWNADDPQGTFLEEPSKTRYGYRKAAECTEEEAFEHLTIYPNPANDFIFIDSELINFSDTRLLIFDTKGAYINEVIAFDTNSRFYDLPDLQNGIYFLQLESKSQDVYLREKLIILK